MCVCALDIAKVRASFPSLRAGFIFGDNAGGSQTARQVIDNIVDYLSNTNAQLGADYSVSAQSTGRVTDGSTAAALLFNAASVDEVGYGPSSTMVFENIARALDQDIQSGDEFIITGEHEANNGPWKRLAERRGAVLKYWLPVAVEQGNPYSLSYKTEDLLSLVSPRTRLVAITGCSNILGTIYPIRDIVAAVRQQAKLVGAPKVEISVDCVAYAPHRQIDVQKWDIDYCVFAMYKVYGAHNAAFYIRAAVLQSSLNSLAHHFLAVDSHPMKIQVGGPGYELVHGASGVVPYLLSLTPENNLQASFAAIAEHEQSLVQSLVSFLTDRQQYDRGVRLFGTSTIDLSRVPTVSFVVTGQRAIKSKDVVAEFDKEGDIGIRYGHFYAYSLIVNATPKLDPADGVVRISLVHYNTVEEVERIDHMTPELHADRDGRTSTLTIHIQDLSKLPRRTDMTIQAASGPDPILLTLFANRFMSVAEAMGRSLQQTSISTNIKERLDFSCALFAPDGDLVANAPFIPIHLGSMSFAVKYQMKLHGKTLEDGDVLMTNSPHAGGSHLPDITVITPVFDTETNEIIFFTASRGHHADIGGILPGSMPPTSVNIFEEGAEIVSLKIVNGGVFDQKGLYEYMVEKPAQYPGSSGCRNIRDVESDLKAQIAANYKGVQLIRAMVNDYGLKTVQEYMYHIRANAENSVRNLLMEVAKRAGSNVLTSVDYLDDGTPIKLRVEINEETRSAVFDFEGTGCEVRGNLNSPISVVHSAVIYCMRAMLNVDIPLNAGCLVPLDVRIPKKSLLSPSRTAAVCGGNVLTSQRIVDVVLKAFHACAASQGCTNNLTFGTGGKNNDGVAEAGWGYYETIAGGSGAGPGWHGTSGVHTHITNTRIGDVEILERRYPVLLHRFGLRPGSGGNGEWRGGDGVIREFEVTHPLQVSILSERRTRAPYGVDGGEDALMGRNTWIKQRRGQDRDVIGDEDQGPRHVNIGGKATVLMGKGDRLLIETPGGGGWGIPSAREGEDGQERQRPTWEGRGSLAERAATQASF